jgi:hypothetical protein
MLLFSAVVATTNNKIRNTRRHKLKRYHKKLIAFNNTFNIEIAADLLSLLTDIALSLTTLYTNPDNVNQWQETYENSDLMWQEKCAELTALKEYYTDLFNKNNQKKPTITRLVYLVEITKSLIELSTDAEKNKWNTKNNLFKKLIIQNYTNLYNQWNTKYDTLLNSNKKQKSEIIDIVKDGKYLMFFINKAKPMLGPNIGNLDDIYNNLDNQTTSFMLTQELAPIDTTLFDKKNKGWFDWLA